MLIHDKRKKIDRNCAIKIGNECLERVRETKYLGVMVDESLT